MTSRTTLAILALLLLIPALPARAQDGAEAAPRLVLPEPSKDLGEVATGERVTTELQVRNEGDAPLEVLSASPLPGATVTGFDEEIPPGGTGTVRLEIDTFALSGPSGTGVVLNTNDPANPRPTLQVLIFVESYLAALPGKARWIYTLGEPEGSIEQTVVAHDGAEFEVVEVESPAPYIETSFRPAGPDERKEDFSGPQWRLDLRLRADAPPGAITGDVRVRTTHPKQQVLEIPVAGFVRPAVHVTPPEADLGTVEVGDQPRYVTFVIHNFASAPMEILDVEYEIPGVTTDLKTLVEGHKYQLRLLFQPGEVTEGAFEETVVVLTDHEQAPKLEIPVRGELVPTGDSDPPGASDRRRR